MNTALSRAEGPEKCRKPKVQQERNTMFGWWQPLRSLGGHSTLLLVSFAKSTSGMRCRSSQVANPKLYIRMCQNDVGDIIGREEKMPVEDSCPDVRVRLATHLGLRHPDLGAEIKPSPQT